MTKKPRLVKKEINGKNMYIPVSTKGMSVNLIQTGIWEPCFTWIMRKEVCGLVLEVGSNIGYATLLMSDLADKIVCTEPDKRSRRILKKNIKLHQLENKVDVNKFAFSDKCSHEDIYYAEKSNQSGMLVPSKGNYEKGEVKTVTIDSLNIDPNFIKMDIEGYEVEVIKGAMDTLKRASNCKILLEVHPHLYSQERSFEKTLRELIGIGFSFKYVVSAAVAVPDLFKEKGYEPFKVMDCGGGFERGIFKDISTEDAINFCAYKHEQPINIEKTSNKIVRSIMLEKGN